MGAAKFHELYKMEDALDKIRAFADTAHGSQMRKYTPERYIVHPVRVMETCRKFGGSFEVLAAALLHDVLEDTPVSAKELRDFLLTLTDEHSAEKIVILVIDLSDVFVKRAYPTLNRRARKNRELERFVKADADAHTVKYADIWDNSLEMVEMDRHFAPRYLSESLQILRKADKGNPELRAVVLKAVEGSLRELR